MTNAKRKNTAKKPTEKVGTIEVTMDPQTRTKKHGDVIAEAAYYKAQKRGFVPGFETQEAGCGERNR